jgi:arylsulfatase A-like enzyme
LSACIVTVLFSQPLRAESAESERKPNFVVIFIDDMGYGDIGPFGSTKNETPHLDRMAKEGMRLTSLYVAAAVCTPSRAALMTGCYPKRVGLARGSWGGVLFPKDPYGLNPREITIAEALREVGYATGCFGKWHLGDQPEFLPTKHGFDSYFGIPYSNDMWPPHPNVPKWQNGVCPLPLLRGDKVVEIVKDMDDQAQLCRRFTDQTIQFIKQNKDRPFFVYLPHAFIHHPRGARNEFLDQAGIDSETELNELRMIKEREYFLKERTRAQIEEVDWSVGQILDVLRELGLAQDTLVFFTSDNGGSLGSVNTPLRGGKGSAYEGGMREPTIAWWPGKIPADSVCDEVATTMDLLPTFVKLGGGKKPNDRVIDGKDIGPLLQGGDNEKSPHEAFFYYSGTTLRAVRSGPWKLHANGELYNLVRDIGEQQNVAEQYPEIVTHLEKRLTQCRADLDNPDNCRPVGKKPNPEYLVPTFKRPAHDARQ